MINNLKPELIAEIKSIVKRIEEDERPVRERQLRFYKGLELYWRHIQDIFWDSSVKDYRTTVSYSENNPGDNLDPYYSDKIINIYRAHGESIIAALSQEIPKIIFAPDDADKAEDITTAKNWTKTSELLDKKKDTVLNVIRSLYLLYNQGTLAAYIYPKASKKNGTYKVPQYERGFLYTNNYSCPLCGAGMGSVSGMEISEPQVTQCEYCQQEIMPIVDSSSAEEVPVLKGFKEEPKARPVTEFYGPLNVLIPHYIRTQEECGYLILYTESHKAYAMEVAGKEITGGDVNLEFDRWARVSTDFSWNDVKDLITWRRVWLRSWMFNLASEELREELKATFPNGAYCLLMNDEYIEADNESMDDCWVISESPISSHIHAEPLGSAIKPVQDIRNELVTLELQSIEYGIPETFADPGVVDFDLYSKSAAAPGQLIPSKGMPSGRALGDAFTTLKTASFPQEAEEFKRALDQDGQFVLGSFPSIYGGPAQGGSKTYAEYQSSRGQALQRLSITWKLFTAFWAEVKHKSVRIFINEMREDEKFPTKTGGNWINVWIRQSELRGKIGSVEPENADQFPMSFAQKHDVLMTLMQAQIPEVMQVISHPENAGTIARYLAFPELYVPGDDDRTKQLQEISELLEAEPLDAGGTIPSVQVDPEIDDHEVEFGVCVAWLKSDYGLDSRNNNPAGYLNVRAHAAAHKQYMVLLQQQQQQEDESNDSRNVSKNEVT